MGFNFRLKKPTNETKMVGRMEKGAERMKSYWKKQKEHCVKIDSIAYSFPRRENMSNNNYNK